ncbi:MAG: protein-methionine-sulfoxide reductase heme-binding subunit MsrQ [Mangrovicoccus sp.]|nr:protein-methionine-sulfoxide reductase heme-binding subunit MsrQ [Mangrovicoccus sp.]
MNIVGRCNGAARRVPEWMLYAGAGGYGVWLFYAGLTGGLGVEPIKELEHRYGMAGLWLLIAGLAVSPLRSRLGLNFLCWRRAIGLAAFFFILCHFLVWLLLDVQQPAAIAKDLIKRPYITLGMGALILMLPLALSSNNWAMRKLGPLRWRRLHQLTYAVALLGCLHYLMQLRGLRLEPLVYGGAIFLLLALRFLPRR